MEARRDKGEKEGWRKIPNRHVLSFLPPPQAPGLRIVYQLGQAFS